MGTATPQFSTPQGATTQPRRSRRGTLLGGAAVLVVLGAVGGGVWAATSWFATGAQPAEAVPANAVGYFAIDLDPSGAQKLEAVRMLQEFPAFRESAADGTDLKEVLVGALHGAGPACAALDYEDDLAPWIGDRAGFAMLPVEEGMTPLLVLQVAEEDAVGDSLEAVGACFALGNGKGEKQQRYGSAVDGEWAAVAMTDEIARGALSGAGRSALADDEDYLRMVEATGAPGVASFYMSSDWYTAAATFDRTARPMTDMAFEGAAITARFADGALELETAGAGGSEDTVALFAGRRAGEYAGRLPAGSAGAVALDLEQGWAEEFLFQVSKMVGVSTTDLRREVSGSLGMQFPDDVEDLLGEGVALGVGRGFDPRAFERGTPAVGAASVPVGLRIDTGDRRGLRAASGVLDRLRRNLAPEARGLLTAVPRGTVLAVGPDPDYRSRMLAGRRLSEDPRFVEALPDANRATGLVYLDLEALGVMDWSAVRGLSPEVRRNLEPLATVGGSWWVAGGIAHGRIRVTTE